MKLLLLDIQKESNLFFMEISMKYIFKYTMEICLLLIVISMIAMTMLSIEVTEPMKTISLMIVSAYFWQKIPEVLKSNTQND